MLEASQNTSLTASIASFARKLGDNGFQISPSSLIDALNAVAILGIENPTDFKTALRSIFAADHSQYLLFDSLFDNFWATKPATSPQDDILETESVRMDIFESRKTDSQDSTEGMSAREISNIIYSSAEFLREKQFPENLELEDPRFSLLVQEIVEPFTKQFYSTKARSSSSGKVDLRNLIRKNFRRGNEILQIPLSKNRKKNRKFVLLCDVSGSMSHNLEFFLKFIREIIQIPVKFEIFVFSTQLTRVTVQLKNLPFWQAMKQIGAIARDWSGGTRIGECLNRFLQDYGDSMLGSSTVVIIYSDGWDRGSPDLLEKTLDSLKRRARNLLWINPLLGHPDYQPACRGMKIALSFVDNFLASKSIPNYRQLAQTLGVLTF